MEGNKVCISSAIKCCPYCGMPQISCSCNKGCKINYPKCGQNQRPHTHKYFGFTELAGECNQHLHHFYGYTSQTIPKSNRHCHAIMVNTDSVENHRHDIGLTTESAVSIGKGKHIHIIKGVTTLNDNHTHDFIFTTLIEKNS
ncbi:hypothetical protein DCCM_2336 [Desulfocucumis palustris]|uniref:YmaF family protein n=1 Tax=Desulfocucumis palustris TaxID=1898651 RepID=A0A2L2XAE0_9FIRM|nr:YmaF family protein [Desulfocucumis palustris]GBF33237.1 hypothetical protein DCCM_2336 [Desulfocucumis palustris]